MGKKDTIHINGFTEPAINIHYSVGPGAENGPADVKTIQTLIHYLGKWSKNASVHHFGMRQDRLPSISGRCGKRTQQAILNFQIRHAKRLLKIDGLVNPALYEGRNVVGGPDKRYMTITLLHFFASEAALHFPETDYIEGLIKITPELRPWLT